MLSTYSIDVVLTLSYYNNTSCDDFFKEIQLRVFASDTIPFNNEIRELVKFTIRGNEQTYR